MNSTEWIKLISKEFKVTPTVAKAMLEAMLDTKTKKTNAKALYYYIPANSLKEVEGAVGWHGEYGRKTKVCEYDDYPSHRHQSKTSVEIMELIPKSRVENTKCLYTHKYSYFKTIELSKDEIIRYGGHLYIKAFEEKFQTLVWKDWKNLNNIR